MYSEFLNFLRCPVDHTSLEIENPIFDSQNSERIVSATLISQNGRKYEVKNGVINFFVGEKSQNQSDTIDTFGHEWNTHDQWGWIDEPPVGEPPLKYTGSLKENYFTLHFNSNF